MRAFEFQIIWVLVDFKDVQNAIITKCYDPVVVNIKLSYHSLMSGYGCEGSQILGYVENFSLTSDRYDSFVAPAQVQDRHVRTGIKSFQNNRVIHVHEEQLSTLTSQNNIVVKHLDWAKSFICIYTYNWLSLDIVNRDDINLPICSQKRKINLFRVIDRITPHKRVLKDHNVLIQLESVRTYLCIPLVNDILCQESYRHVHLVLLIIRDDFDLLDGFWRKLEHKSLGDCDVVVVIDEADLVVGYLVSEPSSVGWWVMHVAECRDWQLFGEELG